MQVLMDLPEKTGKELLSERYQASSIDSIVDCLSRAEGMAGILTDAAALSLGNYEINPTHIEQTARAIQMEVRDASIILYDFYKELKEE